MNGAYTAEQVREAALEASERIISMVMRGCRRKTLDGMPNVGGKPMGWNDYVAFVVCDCLPGGDETPSPAIDGATAKGGPQ